MGAMVTYDSPAEEGNGRSRFALWLWLAAGLVVMTAWLVAGPAGQATAVSPDGDVVAVVNGQALTREAYDVEVRLKAFKYALAGREGQAVDEAALLNRIIGDMLLLQAADGVGTAVDPVEVTVEIGGILGRSGVTRAEAEALLADHQLAWPDLLRSVEAYLRLTHFIDDTLLADAPPAARAGALEAWLAAQYQAAEMEFDPAFLRQVNPVRMEWPGEMLGS